MAHPVCKILLWCTLLYAAATYVAGQGYIPSSDKTLGASTKYAYLQRAYGDSKAYKDAYTTRPRSACSSSDSKSLCAQAVTDDKLAQVTLLMAASPSVYSSTLLLSSEYAGDVALVAPAIDQKGCNSCTACAVASAAETAMASVLGVQVSDCSVSVQALYFCPPDDTPGNSCTDGATIEDMVKRLKKNNLPSSACMSYNPPISSYDDADCSIRKCNAQNDYATEGRYAAKPIREIWEAQLHIRRYGAVVTRFNVMSDFRPFFDKHSNAQEVYKPGPGATFSEAHAVVLVGYDNDKRFWLAKNSWGPGWADGGYFRVAYDAGACKILTPGDGEAWGITWNPNTARRLPLAPATKAGCYLYQARAADYMSKVAVQFGIDITKFMLANTDNVKDLDAPLNGKQLLVCNPKTGTYVLPGSPSSATPSSGGAAADPQLEALLRIKAAVDTTNTLKEWTREGGGNGRYCNSWRGISCDNKGVVTDINLTLKSKLTGLIGTLPSAAAFAGLPWLTGPAISSQPGITGSIPSDWSQLVQLEDIRLSNNSLTGTIPAAWSSLTRLRVLYLFQNKLTGQLPDSFKELRSLEDLKVYQNQLTGTIPATWSSLTRLKVLYPWGNMLTGQLPDSFKELTALEDLDVSSNQLTGTIPAAWSRLTRLKLLNLFDNKLTGQLPDSFKELRSLEQLDVAINKLSGTIPAWLGTNLSQLKVLNLRVNVFSGTIPASLGNLKQLTTFFLGGNKLTGPLPTSFSNLKAVQELGVEANAGLTGTIPSSWASMTALTRVWLRDNPQLGGCLPATWKAAAGRCDDKSVA